VSFYPHGVPSLSTGTLLRSVHIRKRKFARSLCYATRPFER